MGHSYQFRCKDCKHEQQLYEGWGFMIHDQSATDFLANGQVKLHYKTQEKIINLSKTHNDLHLKMEFRIYRCKNCLQVSDRLYVEVIQNDKVLHKTQFKCSQCQLRLKHTNIHSLKYVICPKCKGNRFLKNKELVIWD
ncbi:hypothetical protein ACUNWD_08675 [Sunxiuqinia sp. A32]|uniref:hypothetical protein n=1 Tax=Sunxiuqinia sp. A32 TaxID=3461496 RepID=UPI00404671FE